MSHVQAAHKQKRRGGEGRFRSGVITYGSSQRSAWLPIICDVKSVWAVEVFEGRR